MRTLVSIGTSVSWGQGLRPSEKAVAIVGAVRGLEVRNYASSGACLWDPDAARYPQTRGEAEVGLGAAGLLGVRANRSDAERPSRRPWLWAQLLAAARAEHDPDVVVVDVGANDVGFMRIVTPGVTATSIALAIQKRLAGNVRPFLSAVCREWPQAKVVLTGYYEAFTMGSDFRTAELCWFLGGALGSIVPDTCVTNSMAWKVGFDRLLTAEASGLPVCVARPDMGLDCGLFTPGARVWGPDEHGRATDHVAAERIALATIGDDALDTAYLERASIGHPNVAGAAAYARAILGCL